MPDYTLPEVNQLFRKNLQIPVGFQMKVVQSTAGQISKHQFIFSTINKYSVAI